MLNRINLHQDLVDTVPHLVQIQGIWIQSCDGGMAIVLLFSMWVKVGAKMMHG